MESKIDLIESFGMTTTAAPSVKEQELVSFGLVESASVNSFADFIPSKFNESKVSTDIENDDFSNVFICHLIFYAVFCITLVLHIFIDLGLGSFIGNQFVKLIGVEKKNVDEKKQVFA